MHTTLRARLPRLVLLTIAVAVVMGCSGSAEESSSGNESAPTQPAPMSTQSTDAVATTSPHTTSSVSTSTPTTTGDSALVVVHPVDELDDVWASQPYATQGNAVGIQFHNGIDYFVTPSETTVVAAISGQVMDVRVMERQPDGAFQVNLMIVSSSGPVLSYSLEPSAGPADAAKIAEQEVLANQMLDRLTIEVGDEVTAGQPIGVLLGQDEWAHVHMTLKESNSQPEVWLCPTEFMAAVDADALTPLIETWAGRLYGGSKQPELCNR